MSTLSLLKAEAAPSKARSETVPLVKYRALKGRLKTSDAERSRQEIELHQLHTLLFRASIVIDLTLAAMPAVKREGFLANGARNFGDVDDVTFGVIADRMHTIIQS